MIENRFENSNQVSFKSRTGYFFGNLSTGFQVAIPTFLIFYGTQSLAISIGALSLMMAVVKVLDGFTDVIAGFLIDKTKSTKGKARPWFLWMSFPYALCFGLEFCIPPVWGSTAKILILGILYAMTISIFGTMLNIANVALLPRLTSNLKERGVLAVVCGGAGITMVGILMAVVFPLVFTFGFQKVFIAFSIISFILCILCYLLVQEQDFSQYVEKRKENKVRIRDLFFTILNNKYALLIFIYVLIVQAGGSMILGCGTYYATYVLENPNIYSQFMLSGAIGSFFGIFLGLPLVKRIGTKKLYCLGCLMAVFGFGTILITDSKFPILVVVAFFFILMGGQVFTNSQNAVLTASAIDYGEWKNGVRAEGVTACVGNVGMKVGAALGTVLMGVFLAINGFAEGGVAQSEQAINAIKLTFTGLTPLIYFLLFVVFVLTYRLEKRLPDIQRELEKRNFNNSLNEL